VPSRQRAAFLVGCWAAIGTALLHMVGHVQGPLPPANDQERQLLELATTYRYALPGAERTMMDLLNGFSLIFSVTLAALGGLGLVVARRALGDPLLMVASARVLAGASAVMLVIAVTNFFIIPVVCLALVAAGFGVASVKPPAEPA
jgi:hypothetical protein